MAKPVILTVDDDSQILRADSPDPALEMPGKQGKCFTERLTLDVGTQSGG